VSTNSPTEILVVDDHEEIRESLRDYLDNTGYNVTVVEDASAARSHINQFDVDLVLLDIMMPGEDGISLCRHLREVAQMPVIFLTARGEETDRIVGLEIGADDYVVKPFNPRELLARIKSVLNRVYTVPPKSARASAGTIAFDRWHLDRQRHEIFADNGQRQALSRSEYDLLQVFLRYPHSILTRDQLLQMTQGRTASAFDRTIDNQIRRLRQKLESEPARPQLIKTVWGRGYSLDAKVRAT
jgi:two-component system OmpR family response regulator